MNPFKVTILTAYAIPDTGVEAKLVSVIPHEFPGARGVVAVDVGQLLAVT
jgi:hypothetical protein